MQTLLSVPDLVLLHSSGAKQIYSITIPKLILGGYIREKQWDRAILVFYAQPTTKILDAAIAAFNSSNVIAGTASRISKLKLFACLQNQAKVQELHII